MYVTIQLAFNMRNYDRQSKSRKRIENDTNYILWYAELTQCQAAVPHHSFFVFMLAHTSEEGADNPLLHSRYQFTLFLHLHYVKQRGTVTLRIYHRSESEKCVHLSSMAFSRISQFVLLAKVIYK